MSLIPLRPRLGLPVEETVLAGSNRGGDGARQHDKS
jgi:hypothetical protein